MVELNKAERSSKGDRVLCDSLSFSALSVQFGGATLEAKSSLAESGVKSDSVLEITRAEKEATRKRCGQWWDAERERKSGRQSQRKREEARTEQEKMQKQAEEAEIHQRALDAAAKVTDMLQKDAKDEMLAKDIEDHGQDAMKNREALEAVNGGIYVERSNEREHLMPVKRAVDPYDDEDADKENRDPQDFEANQRIP